MGGDLYKLWQNMPSMMHVSKLNCLKKSEIKALCSKSMLLQKGKERIAYVVLDKSSFKQISTIGHQYYLDCYIHAFLLQAGATLLQLLVRVYPSFPRLDNQQHVLSSDWCHLLSMLAMLVNRLVCESRLFVVALSMEHWT